MCLLSSMEVSMGLVSVCVTFKRVSPNRRLIRINPSRPRKQTTLKASGTMASCCRRCRLPFPLHHLGALTCEDCFLLLLLSHSQIH